MDPDVDTFLVTVYALVDDIYKERFEPHKPVRPGPRPDVSDSEVLALALLCQWRGVGSERAFLRFVRRYWSGYFPRLLGQSSFNRRVRDLWGVLAALVPEIARRVEDLAGRAPAYEAVDGTAVPLVRRCRGGGCTLFGDAAAFGRGGADRAWYYGMKLMIVVDRHGAVSGFAACRADTAEPWLAEAVFRWRSNPAAPHPGAAELADVLGPTFHNRGRRIGPRAPIWPVVGAGVSRGCPLMADLGYAGREWARHWWESYGAAVATPKGLNRRNVRALNGMRQLVERVNATLLEGLGLAFPGARSRWGVMARISAKVAAFNVGVLFNRLHNRPTHAIFNPIG